MLLSCSTNPQHFLCTQHALSFLDNGLMYLFWYIQSLKDDPVPEGRIEIDVTPLKTRKRTSRAPSKTASSKKQRSSDLTLSEVLLNVILTQHSFCCLKPSDADASIMTYASAVNLLRLVNLKQKARSIKPVFFQLGADLPGSLRRAHTSRYLSISTLFCSIKVKLHGSEKSQNRRRPLVLKAMR